MVLHRSAAQTPVDRIAVNAFRDSLRTIADTARLGTMERREHLVLRAHPRDDVERLRLGFTQLRYGELEQEHDDFREAGATFDAVTEARGDWPLAWLGRGLAQLNIVDNQSALANTVAGFFSGDPVADAASKFERCSDLDPGDSAALLTLASIALADYHPVSLRAALLALRHAAGRPVAANPAVALDRVRIERVAGSADSARALAAALLTREPDDPATLLESGRAAFIEGDDRGANDWFRGLAAADSSVVLLYRADLAGLLPDSLLRRFERSDNAGRIALLQRFLEVDEFGQPRAAAARLREHYRRLDHARIAFARPTPRYLGDMAPGFHPTGREMDERGLVWVLHGPPDDHTYLNLMGAPPNETWHYKGDDGGELLFNFIRTDSTGYRRVSSIFDVLAMTTPLRATGQSDVKAMAARGEAVATYGASWTAQTVQEMLYSRENTSPTYAKMLSQGKRGALELQQQERITGDSSIAHGESRAVSYELPLEAQVDAVAVSRDAGGTLLHLSFAIPGTSLYAAPGTGPVVYAVRLRVSVLRQGSGEVVVAIDTLRHFVAKQAIGPEGELVGQLPIHVPPGDYSVRAVVETPGRGVVVPRQVVRVAADDGTALDLSDVALGTRSVPLPWRTGRGDTVWANPLRTFHRTEAMQLYFEVAGVASGTKYHAFLAVYRKGADKPAIRLGFAPTASSAPDVVQRDVDISGLGPGDYRMEVAVTTADGARATRQREFTVLK
jgi:hypothetical protein